MREDVTVPFGRPEEGGPDGEPPHEPGTIDFLGFTHYFRIGADLEDYQ